MNADEPTPLPAEADLARINDALDARVDGRAARVPGTLDADPQWVEAVHTVRDALRRTDTDEVLAPHRETALAAALAVFDAEWSAGSVTELDTGSVTTATPLATEVDTEPGADPHTEHTGTVVRPLRWRRAGLVMTAAATVLFVGVALTVDRSSDDMESSGGDAAAEIANGGVLDATATATMSDPASQSIDNAPPGNTIGAIEDAAVAAPVIDTADELLALARTYEADLVVTGDSQAPAAVSVAGEARSMSVYDCPLTADQVALAEVQWQGTLGVAVFDTVTGLVTVIDPTCTVLTSVGP